MYRIKTRNWNGSRVAHALLTITPDYWDAKDLDIKCYAETKSTLKAWALWAYWMLLCPLSGGWTYIVRPGHGLTPGTYKSIY